LLFLKQDVTHSTFPAFAKGSSGQGRGKGNKTKAFSYKKTIKGNKAIYKNTL
jgi:hypothetical protein